MRNVVFPEQPFLTEFEAIDDSAGDHDLVCKAFCRKYGWDPETTVLEVEPSQTHRIWVATSVQTWAELPGPDRRD